MPLTEATYTLLEFKKKREEKGEETSFKEIMEENFPNMEEIRTSEFMKLIGHPKFQPKIIFSKIHYDKNCQNQTKRKC